MPRARVILAALFSVVAALAPASSRAQSPAGRAGRAITAADAANWKSIRNATLADGGQWFAYQLMPNEGDGEVVVRATKGTTEYRFPIGEVPTGAAAFAAATAGGAAVAFSSDSKWLAFTIAPDTKDAKRLRKEKKPLYNKVALVDLATGKKTDFQKARRFAFAGERGGWVAVLGYGPENAPSPGGAPPAGPAAPGAAPPAPTLGADLLLRQLSTGLETNIGNVGEFAFDKKGDWLALSIEARDQIGNGVQLRSMTSDVVRPLDSDRAWYKRLSWSDNGKGLAVLKGVVPDTLYTDTLYSVVAFTTLSPTGAKRTVFDPREGKSVRALQTVSPDRTPTWTDDATGIFLGIHGLKHEKKTPPGQNADEDKSDLVLWHWKDPRLQSQQQVEEGRDKSYSYAAFFRVSDGQFVALADDSLRDVTASANGRFVVGADARAYELAGNLDGHRYRDVYAVDLASGQRRVVAKKSVPLGGGFGGGANLQSPDGSKLLGFDDGNYVVYDLGNGSKRTITDKIATSFWDTEDDHNVVKPAIAPVGWTKGGASVLLSDGWDVWMVPVDGGSAVNLTGNGKKNAIRYTRLRLDRDEKEVDLTKPQYFRAYGEWTKKEGIARVEPQRAGVQTFLWDDAKVGVIKAKEADVFAYAKSTSTTFPDYYITDGSFARGTRLTDANPQQKDFAWSSGAKLVDYVSDKGDKLQAALYLPANYQQGKSYPAVVYIYEKLSQNIHAYDSPSNTEAMNIALYTSRGYAVLEPDIRYKLNDPGMSAVWSVIPALKAAVASGVVDSSRVGLQGHSWGGYQTAFLVTQTNAFKAAIAGAPLTDMVSMYLSIYWNSGGGDMAIFEASQGRFTGAWWDNWDAYYRNTPIFAAKNVTTPLIILHNDKDGAVDHMQGIEYYNTLRRMQKPVVMLEYKGENHGLVKPANQKDYAVRMREFFDYFLTGAPAPDWWNEGVPHLKMGDHLKSRRTVADEKAVQVP
ncbi:MAG: prolyl oligopeptidase family serine peptidase [Gemmatimonadaceae bacterium]